MMKNNDLESSNCKQVNEDERKDAESSEGDLHPLENFWSLWVFINEKNKLWKENLVCAGCFDTMEDFRRLYYFTKLPSELKQGQNLMIFKDDIKPSWNHPANRKGGRWLINLDKKGDSLNVLWQKVVLHMIEENFVHNEIICGVVINVRVKSKIGLWLSDVSNKEKVKDIGRALKDIIGINERRTCKVLIRIVEL